MGQFEPNYHTITVTAGTNAITHCSLHSAFPATSGNELSVTRAAVSWGSESGGQRADTADKTIAVPSGVTVAAVGLWSAATGGTLRGSDSVTSETFSDAGEYKVTSITVTHQNG